MTRPGKAGRGKYLKWSRWRPPPSAIVDCSSGSNRLRFPVDSIPSPSLPPPSFLTRRIASILRVSYPCRVQRTPASDRPDSGPSSRFISLQDTAHAPRRELPSLSQASLPLLTTLLLLSLNTLLHNVVSLARRSIDVHQRASGRTRRRPCWIGLCLSSSAAGRERHAWSSCPAHQHRRTGQQHGRHLLSSSGSCRSREPIGENLSFVFAGTDWPFLAQPLSEGMPSLRCSVTDIGPLCSPVRSTPTLDPLSNALSCSPCPVNAIGTTQPSAFERPPSRRPADVVVNSDSGLIVHRRLPAHSTLARPAAAVDGGSQRQQGCAERACHFGTEEDVEV